MRTIIPADADLWRRTGQAFPACTADACHQGRDKCPCPDACRVPESVSPAFEGLLSRPCALSAALVGLAALGAIFWPY